jgi:superfamily I DNA/RNA helicase
MTPTKQQEIIINFNENAVVIAAPGSGKTFVISQKIKKNLNALNAHEGIIAISYTNKASNELKKRSLSNGENPKASFFGSIDKFNLSEILIPFGKLMFGLPANEIKIIKIDSLEEFEAESLSWIDRSFSIIELDSEKLDLLINYFLNGKIFIETIGLLSNYILNNSISCQKYIKSKYRYIYIDEYQDSGEHQHEIFLKIESLGVTAIAVGDLNQSIFAFSGKDSKFLEELSKNEDFKYFKLDKNHRCHPSIINYSNYLLNDKTELIPEVEKRVFYLRTQGTESSIAEFIDKNLIELKKQFNLEHNNQIALLVRASRTAEILVNSLKTSHRYFVTNELDSNLNIWSLIFSNLIYYIYDPKHKFIDVIEVFTSYDKFTNKELFKLKNSKIQLEKVMNSDIFDINVLKEEFIKIAMVIAPNLKNEESTKLLEQVFNSQQELNSYKPANDDELIIMTLHKSKGLEFDLVIHLDLYEWVLPSKQPGANSDFNNPIYPSYKQDLNLHYVGITRAIKACILFTSSLRTNYKNEIKNSKDSEFLGLNGIQKLRYTP